jgi:DNA (cytosine-5)-methyltransferase 1
MSHIHIINYFIGCYLSKWNIRNRFAMVETKINKAQSVLPTLAQWSPEHSMINNPSVQVIDLFSGCGGMSLGFAAVGKNSGGFNIIGAADIDAISLNTYRHNFKVPALRRDVRELASNTDSLKSFLTELEYDPEKPLVLIGCPPCQGFTAHRKKNWGTEDLRNNLVVLLAEIATVIKPDCLVMENVPELLSGRYWVYFEAFRKRMESEGYVVKQAIHNAAEYGVPQERFRAIIIAMRSKYFLMPQPEFQPSNFRTVRDAIGDLPPIAPGEICGQDKLHRCANHRQATIDVIRKIPRNGGKRPVGVGPACLDRTSGFSDVYGRLAWDKPAITITHYARNPASGRYVHPDQDRGLTIREAARLQGFPDTFEFTGPFDAIFRQIGEAVPPPLSVAVATAVLSALRGDLKPGPNEKLIHEPVSDSFASTIAGMKIKRK